jgi:DNA-binding XRE family transcriptional regulator
MTQAFHSLARTTHLIRKEIRESDLSQAELARRYNVSRQTIRAELGSVPPLLDRLSHLLRS